MSMVEIYLPVICETPGCTKEGEAVNEIILGDDYFSSNDAETVAQEMDMFFEGWQIEPEDICPVCHQPGILNDAL